MARDTSNWTAQDWANYMNEAAKTTGSPVRHYVDPSGRIKSYVPGSPADPNRASGSSSAQQPTSPGVPTDPALRRELELQRLREAEAERKAEEARRRIEEAKGTWDRLFGGHPEGTTWVRKVADLPPLDPALRRELELRRVANQVVEDPALRRELELSQRVTPLQERGGTLYVREPLSPLQRKTSPPSPPPGSKEWVKAEIEKRGMKLIPDEDIGLEEEILLGGLVLAEKVRGTKKRDFPEMSWREDLALLRPGDPLHEQAKRKLFQGFRHGIAGGIEFIYTTGYMGEQIAKRAPGAIKDWYSELNRGYIYSGTKEAFDFGKTVAKETAVETLNLGLGVVEKSFRNPGFAVAMLAPIAAGRGRSALARTEKPPEPIILREGDLIEADVLEGLDIDIVDIIQPHPTKKGMHERVITQRARVRTKKTLVPAETTPRDTFIGEMYTREELGINADPWKAPDLPYLREYGGVDEFPTPSESDFLIFREEFPSPPEGEPQYISRKYRVHIKPRVKKEQKSETVAFRHFKGQKPTTLVFDELGNVREIKATNPWREEKIQELVDRELQMREQVNSIIEELQSGARRKRGRKTGGGFKGAEEEGELITREIVETEPPIIRTHPRPKPKTEPTVEDTGLEHLGESLATVGAGIGEIEFSDLKPREPALMPKFEEPEYFVELRQKHRERRKPSTKQREQPKKREEEEVVVIPGRDTETAVLEVPVTGPETEIILDITNPRPPQPPKEEEIFRFPKPPKPPTRRGFFNLFEGFDLFGSVYREVKNPVATAEEFLFGRAERTRRKKKKKSRDIFDLDFGL